MNAQSLYPYSKVLGGCGFQLKIHLGALLAKLRDIPSKITIKVYYMECPLARSPHKKTVKNP